LHRLPIYMDFISPFETNDSEKFFLSYLLMTSLQKKLQERRRNVKFRASDEMNYFFLLYLSRRSHHHTTYHYRQISRVSAINFNYPEVTKEWTLKMQLLRLKNVVAFPWVWFFILRTRRDACIMSRKFE
jgi:hypothetical protein